ncbi:MAG: hypothetical protein J6N52_10745 [Clostridia bacterium]|nr:hypothetical protein [Clostridia bacterium]
MKKNMCIFSMALMLFCLSITAFAGSVPEDLLHSDEAQLFFGEVVSYQPDGEIPYAEVIPTKKIKGDVTADGSCVTYQKAEAVGDIDVTPGKQYLFTWYDGNNPTNIFDVTSYDTKTLKLKNVTGDMWKRFQEYLNEGKYEAAERERLDNQNIGLTAEGEDITLTELIGVNKDAAEEINIYYNGNVFTADTDEFYKAADSIILTDIEDVPLGKQNVDTVTMPSGMYITVNGFEGYAFITDDCKADKYAMHLSRMPNGKYTIKAADLEKLKKFTLSEEEKTDLPFLEAPIAGKIIYGAAAVLAVFIIGFVIGFMTKKKKR